MSEEKIQTIGVREAREKFANIVTDASAGVPVVITLRGRPIAAVVSARCTPEDIARALDATKLPTPNPSEGETP